MLVHQSDLSSYGRCPEAFRLERTGSPRKNLSSTVLGTVLHWVNLNIFEQKWRSGTPYQEALDAAIENFEYYWDQRNIHKLTEPVNEWIARETHAGLRRIGIDAIKWYCEWSAHSEHEVLATEYSFQVPIAGTWDDDAKSPHILAGTVDRLSFAFWKTEPTVLISDLKFSRHAQFLRQRIQFSAYAYATECVEFWTGWNGEDGFGEERGREFHERYKDVCRRAEWVNLREMETRDAGFRGHKDYERFAYAVNQFAAAVKYSIYPLSLEGDHCHWCDLKHLCAGVGLPDERHGGPVAREVMQPNGRTITRVDTDLRSESRNVTWH